MLLKVESSDPGPRVLRAASELVVERHRRGDSCRCVIAVNAPKHWTLAEPPDGLLFEAGVGVAPESDPPCSQNGASAPPHPTFSLELIDLRLLLGRDQLRSQHACLDQPSAVAARRHSSLSSGRIVVGRHQARDELSRLHINAPLSICDPPKRPINVGNQVQSHT